METVTNVSAGKPATGGAVYRAPLGTTLPTDATTALGNDFTPLGFCSDDGLINSNSPETETVKAWGGQDVLSLQQSKPDTFQLKLIEVLNPDVLKAVYGDDNVTGTLATGISVDATSDEAEECAWVIDMVMRDGAIKRITIPDASITAIDDIVYKDDEAVGYGITLNAMPDSTRKTHHEYIVRV